VRAPVNQINDHGLMNKEKKSVTLVVEHQHTNIQQDMAEPGELER